MNQPVTMEQVTVPKYKENKMKLYRDEKSVIRAHNIYANYNLVYLKFQLTVKPNDPKVYTIE